MQGPCPCNETMLRKRLQRERDKILRLAGTAINRYGLIRENQKVGVAVSGGKDSCVLLEALALRLRHIPVEYELVALHVRVENTGYEIDMEHLESFCGELKVPLHVRTISPDFTRDRKKSPCFVCSWHKRKELFKLVNELGCSGLALGHNMDDAVETLLMNMIYNASIYSMPPRLSMFGGEFDIIRPLYLIPEKVLSNYARIRGFPSEIASCRFSGDNRREEMRELVRYIEKRYSKGKNNIFHSMSRIGTDYLPAEKEE